MDFHPEGLLGLGIGILVLKHRRTVRNWVGAIDWAERYLGSGGTQTAITFGSILLCMLSVIHAFGGLGTFLLAAFGPVLPGLG